MGAPRVRLGLIRCLRRHGVGDLAALKPKAPALVHKSFKSDVPSFAHMGVKCLPQMADQTSPSYQFVAIDRATRWVVVQIMAQHVKFMISTGLTFTRGNSRSAQ